MKKDSFSTKLYRTSENASLSGAGTGVRSRRLIQISEDYLEKILAEVRGKITEGLSSAAAKLISTTLDNYSHTPDNQAKLYQLLAYTLETQGQYKESLQVIEKYDDEELLDKLDLEHRLLVIIQLAISLNNTNEHPKAVALLNYALEEAEAENLKRFYGEIYIALARVYRKLNEFPIARDHAEKALNCYRTEGNWHGMANAYHMIAMSFHQEGNSEKSIEYFDLAVKIIGERSAPYLLGKIYSDMSGALWFLRRPQDGIACLEKSIKFFEKTEHKIQSIAAYNNLGLNLVLIGDWGKGEKAYQRALDLAIEANHIHVAGILDSLGELKILRGDLKEAKKLLERSIVLAEEGKKEWYLIQSLRNLARCFLLQGKLAEAKEKAQEAIKICKKIGETLIANLANLILAEVYLEEGEFDKCERQIEMLEEADAKSDFSLLGNIQRVRGLLALKYGDWQLGVHHFSSALTIFEAAGDLYHKALLHYLIGKTIFENQPQKSVKHLISAGEIFRKLGIVPISEEIEERVEKLKKIVKAEDDKIGEKKPTTVSSQLLMLRLAEATASRELIFRELVAILRQESKADKIIVAEINDEKRIYPFITHGYTPDESAQTTAKLQESFYKNDLDKFSKAKNVQVFHLRAPSSNPAFLLISPRSEAILENGSSIQPLLRVVELGMDVCALRDKDKYQAGDQEISPYTSNSLMPGFIHSSPAMTSLVEEVYKIRSSDVTVLVTGESGTGKELVARAIHTVSSRKDKIFIPFNCTAVPKELAEGHLFGYRKGAFTGAVTDSLGMIRAADDGTLFLDEIGDLPIDVQPKLLRFLQEGEVQPIGERKPIQVDVRVIAATNMPLEEKVADGSFREDLYYRLNVIRLRVPPLRERRSEIPPMINYYLNHYSARFHKRDLTITPQTIDLLMVGSWEGNVRQLCNEVQRIVARAEDGEKITPDHLSPEIISNVKALGPQDTNGNVKPIASYNIATFNTGSHIGTLGDAVTELETQLIQEALKRHEWNISRAANELGVTRRGLYMKLARYGIEKAA
ncbi:MAG: sigma 54-interacting transcriptional regulator [Acidobacteriota bacterium]